MNKRENNPSKCPICGRPTHKESKYCIFHASAEEKTEEEFKQALKEYINKIKKEDKDYHFKEFIFVGDIDFKKDLNITVFGNANFRKTIFNGRATFKETTFKSGAYFAWTIFNGPSFFSNSTFEAGANFTGAIFKEHAFFSRANFKTATNFTGATFKENAYFTFATFNGYAIFDKANFKGDVSFYLKNLLTYLSLNEAKVFPGKKLSIDVNNGKNNIYFKRAYLENACLNLELCEDVFIDLTDTLLRNTKIKKDQIKNHIFQEKEKNFSEAQEIYLLLKNNFHSIGRYNDESWAFKKEKDMERKSYFIKAFMKNVESKKEKNEEKDQKVKKLKVILYSNWMKIKEFGKWLWSGFCNIIYGYGEKPWNVVISAGVIIIFSALLFSSIGISNPEIIDLKGITVNQNTGNIVDSASRGLLKNNVIRNIPDSLYFSLITFTTLGYGDFRPLEGCGRILAGLEAFIGAFMMALFVYTFARRTGGR